MRKAKLKCGDFEIEIWAADAVELLKKVDEIIGLMELDRKKCELEFGDE